MEEILETYGRDFRIIHQRLVPTSGGMEAEPSQCTAPDGELKSWVYPEVGLQVYLQGAPGEEVVESLRFSMDILTGEETFSPCEDPGSSLEGPGT